MKKIMTFALAAMLIFAMAVPASAYDGSTPQKAWGGWFSLWKDFWVKEDVEPTQPEESLSAPVITQAKFRHTGVVASAKNQLKVTWDAVDGAESYEIEIIKADGMTKTYTSESNSLLVKNAVCPRVYIESTSTWAAASVRVRAVAGEMLGPWSESSKVGCDMLHQ